MQLKILLWFDVEDYATPESDDAWAPQVFPALKKWGKATYLDAHPIIGTDGSPFWYGGILCLTRLINLIHMKHDESALARMKADFDGMNLAAEKTVFLSVYDHPTELCCSEFWDEINFAKGRNPAVLKPAPLRADGEMERYVHALREFISYTLRSDRVEYCTASEALRYERVRQTPISAGALCRYAKSFDGNVDYALLEDAYVSAQELFSLASRRLTGRALLPEFMYGPEKFEASVVRENAVSARELAQAAYGQYDKVLGYKQMLSLYRVGDHFLNPVDLLCTMLEAIHTGEELVEIKTGKLAAAEHVDETYRFGGNWILWNDLFEGKRIVDQTKLQAWTLKPAIF